MTKLATASINSFGPMPEADVPPEDPIFVLTSSQLQVLITQAIDKATQPLQDELSELKTTIASQGEEIASMRPRLDSLDDLKDGAISRICLDIAYDRRRLSKLEHPVKEPGKTEITRAEKIEKYLASRPDHKVTFEALKGHLGVDKNRLNEAIKTLMKSSPGRYGIIRASGDKRKRTLIMLPR